MVLGGYGLAGKAVVASLLRGGFSVVAVGRSLKKLQSLERSLGDGNPGTLRLQQADVGNVQPVLNSLAPGSVVINCVGPYIKYGMDVLESSIEHGLHYIDLASEQQHWRNAQSLYAKARENRVTAFLGAGAYPGLSGLMLRRMMEQYSELKHLELRLAMAPNPSGQGIAQILSGALEMVFPLEEKTGSGSSGQISVSPGTTEIRDLPDPFGRRRMLRWPQLEILALESDEVPFQTFIWPGHDPEIGKGQVKLVRWMRPHKSSLGYRLLQWQARKMASGHVGSGNGEFDSDVPESGGIVEAILEDRLHKHRMILRFQDTEEATAFLPVHLAGELLKDASRLEPGISSPMQVLDGHNIQHLLAELAVMDGVSVGMSTEPRGLD
tara:strand:+ start:4002 stop:5144 length:1143 start_codon:yes stop_codon:yes gene_type:complete